MRCNGAPSYRFAWNLDAPTPHLTGISNVLGTGENFTFLYAANAALTPPFGNQNAL